MQRKMIVKKIFVGLIVSIILCGCNANNNSANENYYFLLFIGGDVNFL